MGKYRRSNLLYRPKIDWKRVVVYCLAALAFSLVMSVLSVYVAQRAGATEKLDEILTFIKYVYWVRVDSLFIKLMLTYIFIIWLIYLKPIMIFCVRLYQCYAPDSIRLACRFKPSCSQYMIMAIEKYGAVIGFIKGMDRLSRCHAPNGGDDYP